jgi:nucleoid DNA-binding protein
MISKTELPARVQSALNLSTKKEAEAVIRAVISALEQTLIDHLSTDGFSIKLESFGKFKIRHKPSIYRKIPFTGETKLIEPKRKVKFVVLGNRKAKRTDCGYAGKPRRGRSRPAKQSHGLLPAQWHVQKAIDVSDRTCNWSKQNYSLQFSFQRLTSDAIKYIIEFNRTP